MKLICIITFLVIFTKFLYSENRDSKYSIETANTVMIFSGKIDGKFLFQYYGKKIGDISQILSSGTGANVEAYPSFGIDCIEEKALQVTHGDGNMSTDLYLKSVGTTKVDNNVSITKVDLYDNKYPFTVILYYKSFYNEDVIEAWTEISHEEKTPVTLYKFTSFYMPVFSYNPWLTHFHGNWAEEFNMVEEKLERGLKEIKNRNGVRSTICDNPSFILGLNGKPTEDTGDVIAGTLAWTGNYRLTFDLDQKNRVNILAGIYEDASQITLSTREVFETPRFVLTYSAQGKGQASRNIHRWALNYGIVDGNKERMVVLNSWEGVYFDITEEKMLNMIDDLAALGGELFVMDDGWFGDKYPRNNETTSLGDWMINPRKLPNGLAPLIKRAEEKGVKFGIWLEPEMVNLKSELFEKHPEWIIHQENRKTEMGRGGSQMLLDMANPQVQDYVYNLIHDLLVKNPKIAYIKWDANHYLTNMGSVALPAEKQSHVYIEYQLGLQKTLKRIRDAHPNLIMQACSSGGGRASYGFLKYFQEIWISDDTDALSRLYIQWGTSHFYPAIVQAAHVSASPNHQTSRIIPLKFRFDVAMTGRLGMEIQPKDLTPDEYEFSRKGFETYKSIRPVVQFGDQYRLISPYDNKNIASLMYVSQKKDRAVFFAYNLDKNLSLDNTSFMYPHIKLQGIDPKKKYKVVEINKEKQHSNFLADNKVFTGEFLMNAGLLINMKRAFQSIVIEITESE